MSTHTKATTRRLLLPVALLLLLVRPALAGDFIDTRISFTLGDDNFLKSAGEQIPDSPLLSIGDRPGFELPMDNLDLATTGRENELHLVLYKKVEGILPGLTTEVAAALEIDLAKLEASDAKVGDVLKDDSSYIRLVYNLNPNVEGKNYLSLDMFPLSGDRFRAGYLYDLTWGGSDMFPRKKGPSPAFRLGGSHGMIYWWAGMKMVLAETAQIESANLQGLESKISEAETLYSVLAGVGAQPVDGLSIDVSGGNVQMARNPISDVLGELVTATGVSARVAYGRGIRVGLSADLRLVRNDPEYLDSLSRRPSYDPGGGLAWRVAVEGNVIAQVLADPALFGGTTKQWASAAALDLRLQWNYLRINFTGVYRSMEFALLNTPSFVPFTAFQPEAIVQPQIFGAVATDYHISAVALTLGLQAGIEMPAAVKTELYATAAGPSANPTLIGEHTLLVRSSGDRVLLPEGEERLPVFSTRLKVNWYASDMLTLVGFLMLVVDSNASILEVNADLTKSRVFEDPLRFGAGITAQARF